MSRKFSTTIAGQVFAKTTLGAVWQKGREVPDFKSSEWRYDRYGKPMRFADYGNVNSQHGWEVDHIKPVAKGGSDDLSNLQPLQWEKNREKGDKYP